MTQRAMPPGLRRARGRGAADAVPVGGRALSARGAIVTYWPSRDAERLDPPDSKTRARSTRRRICRSRCASSRTGWSTARSRGCRDRRAARRARAELAGRADGGARSPGAAAGGLRDADARRRRRRRSSSTRRWSWRATTPATRRSAFVNGILDAVARRWGGSSADGGVQRARSRRSAQATGEPASTQARPSRRRERTPWRGPSVTVIGRAGYRGTCQRSESPISRNSGAPTSTS